jgi:hypothetical protein
LLCVHYAHVVDIGAPEILILAVFFGVLCALLARRKKRAVAGWGALGFVFGPLALLVLAVLRNRGEVTT